ncbi:peptidylprolyl isomerase [Kolteria novifilia]|uniref:peptidylprolyl isomerase n=1 Tax=Kolteria novifilia TaxID=2527975 RepID=UPI003AF3D945
MATSSKLGFDALEDRVVLDASISVISPTGEDIVAGFTGKSSLVAVATDETDGLPVTVSASTNNSNVSVEVLGDVRNLELDVSGVNAEGEEFSGTIILRLFEDLMPETTSQIISLVESGFYDGLTFHRIIDDFVIQGGDPNGDGTGGPDFEFADEFDPRLTFTSPGLLAMANSGNDTNGSQIFITDIDVPSSSFPQNLNFNHSIFGIMVDGFDIFEQAITTETNQLDRPVNPVTIDSARIVTDTDNVVLLVSADQDFVGTAQVTVSANNGQGSIATDSFTFNAALDPVNDPPFLDPVSDLVTELGEPVSFTVAATDLEGNELIYQVGSNGNIDLPPAQIDVDLDAATGEVTLSPQDGVVGEVNLIIGVRDPFSTTFDTEEFTLTVTAATDPSIEIGLSADSDDGGNSTVSATPTIEVIADEGSTVEVLINNRVAAVATPSGTDPTRYVAVLPADALQLGENEVRAKETKSGGEIVVSEVQTVLYTPSQDEAFIAVGVPAEGDATMTFSVLAAVTAFSNEVGLYRMDDADGTVDGVSPGSANYASTVLNSSGRQVLFAQGFQEGASTTIALEAGAVYGVYVVADATSSEFLSQNPNNDSTGDGPFVYFTTFSANPDGIRHHQTVADAVGQRVSYFFEDLFDGGDLDFNDLVIEARASGVPSSGSTETVRVPGGSTSTTTVGASVAGVADDSTFSELGVFTVDDVDGTIDGLSPGDEGYLAAALAAGRRSTLFSDGVAVGDEVSQDFSGSELIGFYALTGGSAEEFLNGNAAIEVITSFAATNANGEDRFTFESGEEESIPATLEADQFLVYVKRTGGTVGSVNQLSVLFDLAP